MDCCFRPNCAKTWDITTVAVGNDGNEDGDAARIQPPSDMGKRAKRLVPLDRSGGEKNGAGTI